MEIYSGQNCQGWLIVDAQESQESWFSITIRRLASKLGKIWFWLATIVKLWGSFGLHIDNNINLTWMYYVGTLCPSHGDTSSTVGSELLSCLTRSDSGNCKWGWLGRSEGLRKSRSLINLEKTSGYTYTAKCWTCDCCYCNTQKWKCLAGGKTGERGKEGGRESLHLHNRTTENNNKNTPPPKKQKRNPTTNIITNKLLSLLSHDTGIRISVILRKNS